MINDSILAFRRVDNNRAVLAEILKQPVLQAALAAIREAGIPKAIPSAYAGVHPDTIVAHDYHRKVGINEALDALADMLKPVPTASPVEMEEAFACNLPPHLRSKTPPDLSTPEANRFLSPAV